MNFFTYKKLSRLSSWLTLIFVFLMVSGILISEFFQTPVNQSYSLHQYRYLFSENELAGINQFKLNNRLGNFHIAKEGSHWTLKEPRELPAASEELEKIIGTLKQIQIVKIFDLDPINISNFSLEKPLLSLRFGKDRGNMREMKIGLINPIDNSTYLTLSDQDAIFQVISLDRELESYDLSSLVDSHIFNLKLQNIQELKIISNYNKSVRLQLKKEESGWVDKKGKSLEANKVENYLTQLLGMKSQLIFDKLTEGQKKKIDHYLNRSVYQIVITDNENQEYNYQVSQMVHRIPGVKIEKSQTFVMSGSNRKHFYLFSKQYLNLFNITMKKLNAHPLQKFFY